MLVHLSLGARCALAIAVVAAAFLVRLSLVPVLGYDSPYLVTFPAAVCAAFFLGVRAGLLAGVLVVLATTLWLRPVVGAAPPAWVDWLRATIILSSAFLVGLVNYRQRRKHAQLADALAKAAAADEARRESEARLRAISSAAFEGIFIHAEGTILDVNDAAAEMFGYSPAEALSLRIRDVCTPESFEIFLDRSRRHSVEPYEITAVRRDGSRFIAEIRAKTVSYMGRPARAGVVRDITDRKSAEEALRQSESFLRSVVESSGDCIKVLDLEGRILSLSTKAQQILEIADLQTVLHHPWTGLWPAVEAEAVDAAVRQAAEGGTGRFEAFRPMRNGTPRWWNVLVTPILGADGRPERLLAVSRDVTPQKHAEERARTLREASGLLATSLHPEEVLRRLAGLLVQSLADWCLVDLVNDDGQLHRVAGRHRDPEMQPLVDRVRAFSPRASLTSEEAARSGRPVFLPEVTPQILAQRAPDPDYRDAVEQVGAASAVVVPLKANDRVLGVFTAVRDRSRDRFVEEDAQLLEIVSYRAGLALENARLFIEAREANRLKDDFLATLSHELRTPLNAIMGWAHLLARGRLEGERLQMAHESILRNAEAQTTLINDVLDVSRITRGRLRMEVQPHDPAVVIRAAIEAVRVAAQAKDIDISFECEQCPPVMAGDPNRLEQVYWNLLSNAVKFTPAGGKIKVSARQVNTSLRVAVADTGIGIAPGFLPHVFERFRQQDSSTTRVHGGLGLGLAIVRHLVELHGGTVRAESAGEGQGSTFIITLPLSATVRQMSAGETWSLAPGRRAEDAMPDLAGVRVVVVEDEADALELLQAILEEQGATVVACSSARDALDEARQAGFDVLVSDIGMPVLDGYGLLSALRQNGWSGPAIALTGYGRSEDRERALAAGFEIHMSKPVLPATLLAAVARLAGKDAERRQDSR